MAPPPAPDRPVSRSPYQARICTPHTAAERALRGKAARKHFPRSAHADWIPGVDRPDPVAVPGRQGRDRLSELLRIRHAEGGVPVRLPARRARRGRGAQGRAGV